MHDTLSSANRQRECDTVTLLNLPFASSTVLEYGPGRVRKATWKLISNRVVAEMTSSVWWARVFQVQDKQCSRIPPRPCLSWVCSAVFHQEPHVDIKYSHDWETCQQVATTRPPTTPTSSTNAPSQSGTIFDNRLPYVPDPTWTPWTTRNPPRFPSPGEILSCIIRRRRREKSIPDSFRASSLPSASPVRPLVPYHLHSRRLDATAQVYAQRVGISLSSRGGGGSAGSSSGEAVMNNEGFLKFQAEQHEFAYQQINLYSCYLKRDPRQGEILYDREKASSSQIRARLDEHGDTNIEGIQPVSDALKARHFDSSWNWVRQDAILMFYDILFGRLTTVSREITARCIVIMNLCNVVMRACM
ncbi:hypothetical protein F5888DRAFT_1891852 [Russula emetica]|nr:hypothetical protein F5888DRAFT_1891852 [Russula emetica]